MPDQTRADRRYDVVAIELPIVYTLDGDHDPNGLLFTLRCYLPLLGWLRDRWEEDGGVLPALHHRRQRIQLAVDGLVRYEQMLDRLREGPVEHACLAAHDGCPQDRDRRDHEGPDLSLDPRAREVRQNFLATVDELVAVLDELTDGAVDRIDPSPQVRQAWLAQWRAALAATTRALAERHRRVDAAFDPADLAARSGLSPARVRRLLLNAHTPPAARRDRNAPPYDRVDPLRPVPLVRPLVLRARVGETVEIRFENQVRNRPVGLHLQGDGIDGVRTGDGARVGANPSTLVPPDGRRRFRWAARHEGVWPVNDLGDIRGTEQGSNVHGLFGAFVVEPEGAHWHDPETGEDLTGTDHADGLYVDIRMPHEPVTDPDEGYVDLHRTATPPSHREFTVFIHDEPEIHSGLHAAGEHTVMPLSYRAEPMPNRLPHRMRRYAERTAPEPPPGQVGVDQTAVSVQVDETLAEVFRTARTPDGDYLDRVAGEEQHHSSWLFGEPVTPVFRAYAGDPARIRLVHAGVKETHVFHLHVHQWRAVPQDTAAPSVWGDGEPRGSQLLDSITIGPQTAVTIDPLYGSGSRQHAPGDIIWHCHLYPHFHHGMWGLWRSFDRLVDGSLAYPDGTPCPPLQPLPGRPAPAVPDAGHPGFPWFIDATFPQKSPPPPAVLDEHVVGRRRWLRMPAHSPLERNAFAPGCVARPRTGALFVDLDDDARAWNRRAGLPEPRVLSYDVEVAESPVEYNAHGWHDRHGHHYRITGVSVAPMLPDGSLGAAQRFRPPDHGIEPFFPRANHGDVVELRLHNELGTIGPDHFDPTTPPVECGLHVHLVKFDVLAADGSSTGWNYLAGASCREAVGPQRPGDLAPNVGLHRWVVDEEFGPCFFHDHLLANYRQKHGLFAALVAEPHGSQWFRPDQEEVAWSGPEAVVVQGVDGPHGRRLEAYREACLAVGDFIPLYRADGTPLNAPEELGSDEDPGSMGVNYRSTPLELRGDDPSEWFSATTGEPDTPVIRTYPGERLRIRLIQGSHEEQHSFSAHGLRWRREWHQPRSPLVDQQTIGISEAFTLDLDPAAGAGYGPGDHLWQFAALDDVWLGCWGLVRALTPSDAAFAELPPLPTPAAPEQARAALRAVRPVPPRPHRLPDPLPEGRWSAPVREFTVVARRAEHEYDGRHLTDPWGLVYLYAEGHDEELDDAARPTGRLLPRDVHPGTEPLVLRARRGEWVRVTLVNEVLTDEDESPSVVPFGVEPDAPRVPIESLDHLGRPDGRKVTPRVSLHPGLLRYDVVADDGANVGRNQDGTVAPAGIPEELRHGHGDGGTVVLRDGHGHGGGREPNWREYWWYADGELAPASHRDGPGQVALLRDAADIRNHRHHGLVGALVVLPGDVTPVDPVHRTERWWGTHALVMDGDTQVANEKVLVLQDGLRHFVAGHPDQPVPDTVPGDDPEDAGQKGINYRVAPVHRRTGLADPHPPTPVWPAKVGDLLWLRLVCAADKPRNHTFTVHGQAWQAAPWLDKPAGGEGPWVGAVSGVTAGSVHTLVFPATEPGDHAYRSGVFRWAVEQGLWGILRVRR